MKYLEKFIEHLKRNHYAKSSVENYYYILIKTKKYFTESGLTDDKTITEKDILNYMEYLQKTLSKAMKMTNCKSLREINSNILS